MHFFKKIFFLSRNLEKGAEVYNVNVKLLNTWLSSVNEKFSSTRTSMFIKKLEVVQFGSAA
ncbi:hypothetical protein JOC37_001094 [Desulfohalotomaculum tongense]|nr:hypothetical protein [Desulforadius tongensis]